MGMEVFSLVGKMKLDGMDKANKQVGGLQGKVQNMAKGLRIAGAAATAAGAAITGMAIKAVKDYAAMGDEVHKMALRTGFATETLSRLKYAAGLGGTGLQTVEKAAKRLAATLYDAKEGLSTSVDALNNLNLSVADFEGLDTEEAFMKMAGAIASIEDPLQRSALAQRIFGRAGTEMLPMLSQGTEGLKAMMAEAEKFAPIFDQQAAEAAAKLTDTMAQLKGSMDKVKMTIAENLVPVLLPLIEKIRDIISRVAQWMKENPKLTKTIAKVALAVGAILLVLGPLLMMLPTLVTALPMLGGAFAALTGPIGLVIIAIAAMITLGILVVKHWDEISAHLRGVGAQIKTVFQNMGIAMITPIEWAINKIIAGINHVIRALNMLGANIPELKPLGWTGQLRWAQKSAAMKQAGLIGVEGGRVPTLPKFHQEGIVPGPIGKPVAIEALGGERYLGARSISSGGKNVVVNVYPQGSVITEKDLLKFIREGILTLQRQNSTSGI